MIRLDQAFIHNIQELIKAGESRKAAVLLSKGIPNKVPRDFRLPLAWAAKRAGLPELAVRLLNPLVRPSPRSVERATEAEKVEYAACLIKLGASHEALHLLEESNQKDAPEVVLYKAYALITQWQYEASIPLLQQYCAQPTISPYQKIVAQVNLAAAFVNERYFGLARDLLSTLLIETKTNSHQQLHGNVLEICAQDAIFEGRWEEAASFLSRATAHLQESKGLDLFFVHKWQAILSALKTKGHPKAIAEVAQIKQAALDKQHWETVRECDLYTAYATKNDNLLIHIFFGTPYEPYRKKLMSGYGHPLNLPASYLWQHPEANKPTQIMDLQTGDCNQKGATLKTGHLLHRLFLALGSDFYRPFSVAALHNKVYPDQFYNPNSSPAKIHELVKRARQWIKAKKLGLSIIEHQSSYRIQLERNMAIQCHHRELPKDKQALLIKQIQSKWSNSPFSTRDVATLLHLSPRTARRILSEAEKKGTVIRLGSSTETQYKIAG